MTDSLAAHPADVTKRRRWTALVFISIAQLTVTRPGSALLASVCLAAAVAGCSPAVTSPGAQSDGPTPTQATTAESPIPMNETLGTTPPNSDEAAVLKVNRERSRLLVEQRTDELDDLLSADFVAVHITGYEQTKAEWLDQIQSGQMRYHGFEEVSSTVTVDGDSAVAVTRSLVDATIYGSRGTWPLESTTTSVRDGGTWKAQHSRARTY
ncbi:nuclear transport factor 2 family protein [Pseudarthrobacter siccitolerans]